MMLVESDVLGLEAILTWVSSSFSFRRQTRSKGLREQYITQKSYTQHSNIHAFYLVFLILTFQGEVLDQFPVSQCSWLEEICLNRSHSLRGNSTSSSSRLSLIIIWMFMFQRSWAFATLMLFGSVFQSVTYT